MSENAPSPAVRTERCPGCGRRTEHRVAVRLVEETGGSAFAREPYRASKCQACGAERLRRVN
jgi:hypothetical protein